MTREELYQTLRAYSKENDLDYTDEVLYFIARDRPEFSTEKVNSGEWKYRYIQFSTVVDMCDAYIPRYQYDVDEYLETHEYFRVEDYDCQDEEDEDDYDSVYDMIYDLLQSDFYEIYEFDNIVLLVDRL